MFLFVVFLEKTWLSACVWNLMFSDDVVFSYGKFVLSVCGSIRSDYLRALVLVPQIYTLERVRTDDICTGLVWRAVPLEISGHCLQGGNVYGGVQFRALNSSHKKETFPSKTPPDLTSLLAEIYMFCSASLWEIGVEKVETHRLAPLSAIHCGW